MRGLWLKVRSKLLTALLPLVARPKANGAGLVEVGVGYGAWWVPSESVRPDAVAYCVGAGEDITFDLELHEAGLCVRTLDPTPRAIAHVQAVAPASDRFTFMPVGLWNDNATVKFFAPKDPSHVSHSALNLQETQDFFEAEVVTLREAMQRAGDDRVDLLKIDIEGAEYNVLDDLHRNGPLPPVIAVDFDQPQPVRRTLAAIKRLRSAGYELVHIDEWDYTFVRN